MALEVGEGGKHLLLLHQHGQEGGKDFFLYFFIQGAVGNKVPDGVVSLVEKAPIFLGDPLAFVRIVRETHEATDTRPEQKDDEGVLLGKLGFDTDMESFPLQKYYAPIMEKVTPFLGDSIAWKLECIKGLGEVQEVGAILAKQVGVVLLNFGQNLAGKLVWTACPRRLAFPLLVMAFSSF